MGTKDVVDTLMKETVMKAATPEAHALQEAHRLLRDRTRPRLPAGARRRMAQAQALAAATAVTRVLRRLGIAASEACDRAGIEDPQVRAYVFTLSHREMDGDGALVRPLAEDRRVHKSVGAYVRILEAAAAIAGVEAVPLLQEVGEAIEDYLAPFSVPDTDPYEELAGLLALVGPFFGAVRRGPDGGLVDLDEFLGFTAREGLTYNPRTGAIVPVPEEPCPGHDMGRIPSVRLFVRAVASFEARCVGWEAAPEGAGVETVPVELGPVHAKIIEVVSLGLARSKGATRAVLVAEPWTVVFGNPGEPDPWLAGRRTHVPGTPFSDGLMVPRGDGHYGLYLDGDPDYHCDRYEERVTGLLSDARTRDNPYERWHCREEACVPRVIEIEAGILGEMLDGARDEDWRTTARFSSTPPAWSEGFVVPMTLTRPDGRDVSSVNDRLRHALLGADGLVVNGLMAEVSARVRAMDAHREENASEDALLKARFRRLMRSPA